MSELASRADVDGLIDALASDEDGDALVTLAEVGSPDALNAIISYLADPSTDRKWAISALAATRSWSLAAILEDIAENDPDPDNRMTALGLFLGSYTSPFLIQRLGDPHEPIRENVLRWLEARFEYTLADVVHRPLTTHEVSGFTDVLTAPGPVASLERVWNVVESALTMELREGAEMPLRDALLRLCRVAPPAARVGAITALRLDGSNDTLLALKQSLEDAEGEVKSAARAAFGARVAATAIGFPYALGTPIDLGSWVALSRLLIAQTTLAEEVTPAFDEQWLGYLRDHDGFSLGNSDLLVVAGTALAAGHDAGPALQGVAERKAQALAETRAVLEKLVESMSQLSPVDLTTLAELPEALLQKALGRQLDDDVLASLREYWTSARSRLAQLSETVQGSLPGLAPSPSAREQDLEPTAPLQGRATQRFETVTKGWRAISDTFGLLEFTFDQVLELGFSRDDVNEILQSLKEIGYSETVALSTFRLIRPYDAEMLASTDGRQYLKYHFGDRWVR